MPTGGLLDIVGEVVRPLTNDIVDPVVADVAVPVLDGVVDPVVSQTVQPVLDNTVGPVVGSIVDPVVDNVAAPVVDHEVSPALAGAVVTVTHAATSTAPVSSSSSSPTPSWEQTGTDPGSHTVQLSYQISYRPALPTGGIDGVQDSTAQGSPATGTMGIWAVDLGSIMPRPVGPAPTGHGAVLMHDGPTYGSTSATTSQQPSGSASPKITSSDAPSPLSQPVSLPMHEQGNPSPAGSTSSAGGGSGAAATGLAGIAADTVEDWFSNASGRGPIHADALPTGPCFGPGCFPD